MNEIQMCALVFLALAICVVFKSIKPEYSLFIRIIVTVSVSIITVASLFPILTYIDSISKSTVIHQYLPILIKALGIAFIVQLTSDSCHDAGEDSLANRVCLFGKTEILVISLPLVKNLFELCKGLLV